MSLAANSRDLLSQVERALQRLDDRHLRHLRELRQSDRQGSAAGLPACNPVCVMQAARGAAVAADRTGRLRPAPRRARWLSSLRSRVYSLADVVSQARSWSPSCPTAPRCSVIGNVLTLTLTRNAGAAFSIGTGRDGAVLGGRGRRRRRHRPHRPIAGSRAAWAIALGLLLGGALGNLADRVFRAPGPFRGHVIDWIQLPHWPVFNIADSAIVVGGVLAVRSRHPTGSSWTARDGERLCGRVPLPEGLDGLRVDVASVAAVRPVADRGGRLGRGRARCCVDGRDAGEVRPGVDGSLARGRDCRCRRTGPPRPLRRPSRCPACGSSTTTTTSSSSTSRSASAAHPSPGWTGPTVTGGLAAAGYRLSTSGAAERQGVVHRLDVGHHRADGRREERAGVLGAQGRLPDAHRRQALHRAGAGPSRTRAAARSTRRSTATRPTTTGGRWSPAAGRASPTTRRSRRSGPQRLLEIRLETGRTHQIRVHMAAVRHPCVGDLTYGADPTLAARLGLDRQWLHASALGFAHPSTAGRCVFTSPPPADLSGRSTCSPRPDSGRTAPPAATRRTDTPTPCRWAVLERLGISAAFPSGRCPRTTVWEGHAAGSSSAAARTSSCTCTCTASTPCSTARRGSRTCSPRRPAWRCRRWR